MKAGSVQMTVDNCPGCGAIYRKNPLNLCHACVKELEREYRACEEYLRKNRKATLAELSRETGISIGKISRFIKEKRIHIHDQPNMGYACELCGESIRSGKLCPSCYGKIQSDIGKLMEAEAKKQERVSVPELGNGYRINERIRRQ